MDVYNTQMLMSKIYDSNTDVKHNYKRLLVLSHPYDLISTTVTTSFVNNSELEITNAFMKMYEFLTYVKYEPKNNTLKMFDIAGAPGMFIIGTEKYLSNNYPDTVLDWHCCSLVESDSVVREPENNKHDKDKGPLTDRYGLFESNPERFTPCDVTNPKDVSDIISTHEAQYELVTGDIGVYHEDDYDRLQEEKQLDLEYGQMMLALKLVKRGGMVFLKMYTFCTYHSLWLLTNLTRFFDTVKICKPYSSRMVNDESYIIGICRNTDPIPNTLSPDITNSIIETVSQFELNRGNNRIRLVSIFTRILNEYPNISLHDIRLNDSLNIFYNEIGPSCAMFYDRNLNKK